jgi:hypothetical protein
VTSPRLLRALSCFALAAFVAWAWWTAARGAAAPVWYWSPIVGAATALLVAGIFGAWRGDGAPRATWRGAWVLDLSAPVGLLAAGWAVVDAWQAIQTPAAVIMGMDGVSYVENVSAVLRQDWDGYNKDKPILHALLAVKLLPFANDTVEAAVWVSKISIAALPALAWAMARPLFGRLVGVGAGLLVLCDAELWQFGLQTTSYALFAATTTAALATLAAYARWPGWGTAAGVGLALGLGLATSEKSLVSLGPPGLGVALLVAARAWTRPLAWRALVPRLAQPLFALGVAAAFVSATHPPLTYTAPGNLLVNQRREVHVAVPWDWPTIEHPDPAHPYPYADQMPAALRTPALDVTLAALFNPPWRNGMQWLHGDRLEEAPGTTIPPASALFAVNLTELRRSRPLQDPRLALVVAGAVLCLAHRRSRPGILLATALLSGVAPLFLKFQSRYLLHLLPLGWVLTLGGIDAAARALAGGSRIGALTGRSAAFWLAGSLLVATLLVDPAGWRHPDKLDWPPPWATRAISSGDGGLTGASTRLLAAWVQEQQQLELHDCSPHPIRLYLPPTRALAGGRLDPVCGAPERAAPGAWVVVSDDAENPGLGTHDLSAFRAPGWKLLALARQGRLVIDPPSAAGPGPTVWVYRRDQPDAFDPGATVHDLGAPAQTRRAPAPAEAPAPPPPPPIPR